MLAPILTIASILAAFFLIFFVFFPLGRGAIYVPSTPEKTLLIAELSGAAGREMAADLGSGDGRIVIALAEKGAEAHGFEVNPILVILSRRKIRRAGLEHRAIIHWKSFWQADLARFDVVTLFQGSFVMRRLGRKLRRELAPGARVVSDYWGLPGMDPESVHGTIACYRMPEATARTRAR
jgi:SAM-dependent methyltransferase